MQAFTLIEALVGVVCLGVETDRLAVPASP